jgi:Ca2+/H+ antiporter
MDHIALITALLGIVTYVVIIWASMETHTEDYRRHIQPREDE